MKFNLNNFLFSLGYALNFVEMDILGLPTNHSKRVAYIACNLAKTLRLKEEEIIDVVSLAILHDNGVSIYGLYNESQPKAFQLYTLEHLKEHCIKGEENIRTYPFLTDTTNVIKYHHENYSGSGFFGLKGDKIPLMSQIISLADDIDINFDLRKLSVNKRNSVISFVAQNENVLYSPELVEAFIKISKPVSFWLDLKDDFLDQALNKIALDSSRDFSWKEIRDITRVFSKVIDSKSRFTQRHSSGLAEKVATMSEYYKKDEVEKIKLIIAADLHDIGKLAISNSIIDKPGKLTEEEMKIMQEHAYYTRISLQQITGFEDVTEWASNHHEKLDGTGYPYNLNQNKLDFNSRLMTCLDIYQALKEERPYRKGLEHQQSIEILKDMVNKSLIDNDIVVDIEKVFA